MANVLRTGWIVVDIRIQQRSVKSEKKKMCVCVCVETVNHITNACLTKHTYNDTNGICWDFDSSRFFFLSSSADRWNIDIEFFFFKLHYDNERNSEQIVKKAKEKKKKNQTNISRSATPSPTKKHMLNIFDVSEQTSATTTDIQFKYIHTNIKGEKKKNSAAAAASVNERGELENEQERTNKT